MYSFFFSHLICTVSKVGPYIIVYKSLDIGETDILIAFTEFLISHIV